jgi:60 kDa SS-A/Ro ribonucleoprotein
MRTNTAPFHDMKPVRLTHEGARAFLIQSPVDQLRRSVMACMLFEDTFYESGVDIAQRIHEEVEAVLHLPQGADIVGNIAYEARTKFKLRHAPLWLTLALVRSKMPEARKVVAGAIAATIQRPDELAEMLAMYWKDKKTPLSAQLKKGLAAAFTKFDRYSLSKYANRDGKVKLRDVLFLTHAKPLNAEQAQLWKDLAEGKLVAPDTWESNLSAGKDKKETFERLLAEKQLGALALLRNLRNMQQSGVSDQLIKTGLAEMKVERVLPFRFITAAKYAPTLEPQLEEAMFRCLADMPKLKGRTVFCVDNSGSMDAPVSSKSELHRVDAACALAMLLREICEDCQVVVFGSTAGSIPPRRGFALRDAIRQSGHCGGTDTLAGLHEAAKLGYDRCIVITDEQSHTSIGPPVGGALGYFINVASYRQGIGYGPWTHLDGWSEAICDYIVQAESTQLQ